MKKESLQDKINRINEILRSNGKEAVQEVKMVGKNGQVIGQVRYGYKPQYVFDAVNEVLGPENWRYDLEKEEIFDNQAVVTVTLHIRVDGEWLCKGSQKGQSQIVKGNVGDALKGAVTDAIQKCMSLLSIGTDAYKGLLEGVYKGAGTRPRPPRKTERHGKLDRQADGANGDELPRIDGVSYKRHNGTIIADGPGTFDKRALLKAAGFRWNSAQKVWAKPAPTMQ